MRSDLSPAVRKKASWYVPGGTIYRRTAPKVSRLAGRDPKATNQVGRRFHRDCGPTADHCYCELGHRCADHVRNRVTRRRPRIPIEDERHPSEARYRLLEQFKPLAAQQCEVVDQPTNIAAVDDWHRRPAGRAPRPAMPPRRRALLKTAVVAFFVHRAGSGQPSTVGLRGTMVTEVAGCALHCMSPEVARLCEGAKQSWRDQSVKVRPR
jgi:hypothetical protein